MVFIDGALADRKLLRNVLVCVASDDGGDDLQFAASDTKSSASVPGHRRGQKAANHLYEAGHILVSDPAVLYTVLFAKAEPPFSSPGPKLAASTQQTTSGPTCFTRTDWEIATIALGHDADRMVVSSGLPKSLSNPIFPCRRPSNRIHESPTTSAASRATSKSPEGPVFRTARTTLLLVHIRRSPKALSTDPS